MSNKPVSVSLAPLPPGAIPMPKRFLAMGKIVAEMHTGTMEAENMTSAIGEKDPRTVKRYHVALTGLHEALSQVGDMIHKLNFALHGPDAPPHTPKYVFLQPGSHDGEYTHSCNHAVTDDDTMYVRIDSDETVVKNGQGSDSYGFIALKYSIKRQMDFLQEMGDSNMVIETESRKRNPDYSHAMSTLHYEKRDTLQQVLREIERIVAQSQDATCVECEIVIKKSEGDGPYECMVCRETTCNSCYISEWGGMPTCPNCMIPEQDKEEVIYTSEGKGEQ